MPTFYRDFSPKSLTKVLLEQNFDFVFVNGQNNFRLKQKPKIEQYLSRSTWSKNRQIFTLFYSHYYPSNPHNLQLHSPTTSFLHRNICKKQRQTTENKTCFRFTKSTQIQQVFLSSIFFDYLVRSQIEFGHVSCIHGVGFHLD